jgi:hypothetical protein
VASSALTLVAVLDAVMGFRSKPFPLAHYPSKVFPHPQPRRVTAGRAPSSLAVWCVVCALLPACSFCSPSGVDLGALLRVWVRCSNVRFRPMEPVPSLGFMSDRFRVLDGVQAGDRWANPSNLRASLSGFPLAPPFQRTLVLCAGVAPVATLAVRLAEAVWSARCAFPRMVRE